MAKDLRVLLIKLADRTHNIRTMDPLPEEKQKRVAAETLDVYAPLAHRLGVQDIKHEMEETCFPIVYPKRTLELEELVRNRAPERDTYIKEVIEVVSAELGQAGIEAEVSGRPKHLYSIYRKMIESRLEFSEIFDIMGIRIIVPRVRDCYAALGLVHSMWPPIPGRFKDYIAMPKFNLYQSLHTTVVGPDGGALEVQIRTEEMHTRAEFGIAAHWAYKDEESARMPLVKDIRILQEESADPAEFLAELKLDLYQDEVFALSPKGRVVDLPKGATPVDFAYRIHTDVGHHCVGAKVNGRLVSLSTELESGDIVEIMTSRSESAHPSRDWLDFVKSTRASSKIKQWFRRQRRATALADGRDAVNKAVRRQGLGTAENDTDLGLVAGDLGLEDVEALYAAVGDGRVSPQSVAQRLARRIEPIEEESTLDRFAPPPVRRTRPAGAVIVEGLDDMLVRMARCCGPVPGDDIIGFVTVGRGVSVHRADCANIGALEHQPERMIEVTWAPDQTGSFFVWVQVEALDRAKLLRDVTTVLSDIGANIHSSSSVTGRDRIALLRYEVEVSEPTLLERVLSDLRGVDGVFDAYRLVPGN
jgi:GTP pyrophosphokinase